MHPQIKFFIGGFAILASSSALAASHLVIAPNCLINPSLHQQILGSNKTFTLLKTNDQGIERLIAAKDAKNPACGGFRDVTVNWADARNIQPALTANQFLNQMTTSPVKLTTNESKTYSIQYIVQVEKLLKNLNPQVIWNNLTTLTQFDDRYANSDSGVKAAAWIKSTIEQSAQLANRKDVTVYTIATGSHYKQPSVIAKIGSGNGPGVVISAHMDTLSSYLSKKPGADDNGSGSATVLETAQNLLTSGMTFNKPIYFMWFAAEEEGMVGSGYVVREFKNQNIPVEAVLHFDMTGFAYKNQPDMWLMDDYVNKNLESFIETLIKTYVKQPVQHSRCGYACSDHATWTQNGYSAAIAAEAAYENTNPAMHSSNDTMDKLSLSHMTDYAKLASAFAVELAEPI